MGQPGSGLKVGYLGVWGSLGLDSRWVSWVRLGLDSRSRSVSWVCGAAWVWTQGRLAGCMGLDSRWVSWVRGAALVWTRGGHGLAGCAWVWTQGRLAGYVGQPGSGLKVGYLGAWGSLGHGLKVG